MLSYAPFCVFRSAYRSRCIKVGGIGWGEIAARRSPLVAMLQVNNDALLSDWSLSATAGKGERAQWLRSDFQKVVAHASESSREAGTLGGDELWLSMYGVKGPSFLQGY